MMQNNIFNGFFYLSIIIALLDWYAVSRDYPRFRILSKPLVLIFIISWFTSVHGWDKGGIYFGLALIFSLLGDIFLLKKLIVLNENFFQLGLIAFLLTQIFYIIGFNQAGLPPFALSIIVLIIVAFISSLNGKPILQKLQESMEGKKLI
ncbi:MAG: lysoplasmalogenase family protein, partial [Anaerolineales bacterium]